MRLNLCFVSCLILLVVNSVVCIAEDWPQWRGPNRDGTTPERVHWPADGPKILWTQDIGESGSNVTVADGLLFAHGFRPTGRNKGTTIDGVRTNIIPGVDILQCYDAETGTLVWNKEITGLGGWTGPVGPGPCSSPTIDGERVYFWSPMAVMRCVEAKTGAILWERDLYQERGLQRNWTGYEGSPILLGNMVLINATSPVGIALDKTTGETIWEDGRGAPSHSSHVLFDYQGKPLAVLFANEALNILDPMDGQLVASFSWDTHHWHNSADPIISGNQILISSGYGMGAALLDFTGNELNEVWRQRGRRGFTEQASMVHRDGYVYGMETCLCLRDGLLQWRGEGRLGEGGVILAGDRLVMLGSRGNLIIAPADPDSFKPVVDVPLLDGPAWQAPVLASGRLYVRNVEGKLICLDVREEEGT